MSTPSKWFRALPEHWDRSPVWALFRRDSRKGFAEATLLSVYREYGVIPKESRSDNNNRSSEDLSTYQLVEPGDLVVNKMKAWQGSMAISRVRGIVSPAYFIYRPTHGCDDRYLHYLLRSQPMVGSYKAGSKGIRPNQWDLDPQAFAQTNIPIPPLNEQQAIADYLDHETQKIDELITEQRGLIETLRERRIAIIRALVSGVEQGGSTDPSGEWFGFLPDNWQIAPVLYDFDVTLGKMLNNSKSKIEGSVEAPYVAAGSIQPDYLKLDPEKTMSFTLDELDKYSLCQGDIVVVEGGAGYGRCHYLTNELPGWGFQNHVARVRPTTGRSTGRFLTYCLKACLSSGYIEANNRTSTMPSLSRDVLGAIRIPRPSIDLQESIADTLDDQTARIDELISESEDLIALSQERRAALITAAVTGQVDVRMAA